jgi:hypothetical protein
VTAAENILRMKPNSPKGLERIIPSGMQAARATRPDGFGWADTLRSAEQVQGGL